MSIQLVNSRTVYCTINLYLVLELGGCLVHSGAREVDRRPTHRRARLVRGRRTRRAHRLVEAVVHRRAAVVRELVLLRAVQLAQQRVLLVHPQALLLPRYSRVASVFK